jgi:hypothetical protein
MKPSTDKAVARSPAAERLRRHRQRRRDGFRCVTIELSEAEIDGLVRMGHLKPETRNDATAIREALYSFYRTHWVEYRKLCQSETRNTLGGPRIS